MLRRRVHVAVMDRAAARTSTSRTFSGIFVRERAAGRAQLGARGTSGRPRPVPARTRRPCTPAWCATPPGRVADGAGQAAVLDHVAHGQVLDHERLVLTDEPSGQFVQVVAAPVGDPGVDAGDLHAGPWPGCAEPLCLAGQVPLGRASRSRSRRSCRGLVIFSPVDRVSRWSSPASIPTAAPWRGAAARRCRRTAGTRTSARPRPGTRSPWTAPRPRAAAGTTRCPAARPSSPGSAARRASGTRCGCTRPTRATSSCDLNRGYLARLAKKLVNAACRCRSACCNGTEDTSLRNARSSVFFHAVSIAEVRVVVDPLLRAYHASVRASQRQVVDHAHAPERARQLRCLRVGRVEAVLERPLHLSWSQLTN